MNIHQFKKTQLLNNLPFCKGSNRWDWTPPYFFLSSFLFLFLFFKETIMHLYNYQERIPHRLTEAIAKIGMLKKEIL